VRFGLFTRQSATSVLSELLIFECNSNSSFFKYPDLVAEKKRVSSSRK